MVVRSREPSWFEGLSAHENGLYFRLHFTFSSLWRNQGPRVPGGSHRVPGRVCMRRCKFSVLTIL